jgi:uncharacterized membrane protein
MIDWAHAGATATAAFLASLVEFVEALTIVLAVGTVRGWRPALAGALAGGVLLIGIVVVFGPLLAAVPIQLVQAVVGLLLLLFGMRWLRKAVLRAAGAIAHHDEALAFAAEVEDMRRAAAGRGRWDAVALVASFKAVVLEGLEVVFIVLAIGAVSGRAVPAATGAASALIAVVILGLALHRPLARVPENALKFTVGVLLSAFGVFWLGEGLGLRWIGGDLTILALIAGFMAAAWIAVALSRVPPSGREGKLS